MQLLFHLLLTMTSMVLHVSKRRCVYFEENCSLPFLMILLFLQCKVSSVCNRNISTSEFFTHFHILNKWPGNIHFMEGIYFLPCWHWPWSCKLLWLKYVRGSNSHRDLKEFAWLGLPSWTPGIYCEKTMTQVTTDQTKVTDTWNCHLPGPNHNLDSSLLSPV